MIEISAGQVAVAVILIAVVGGLMKFAAWKGATDERAISLERSQKKDRKSLSKEIKRVNSSLSKDIKSLRKEIARVNSSLSAEISRVSSSLSAEIARVSSSLSAEISRVNSSLSAEISRVNSSLSADIRQLRGSFLRGANPGASGVAADTSPLSLTKLGRDISEMVGAPEWAARTGAMLTPKMKGRKAHQIHDFCFEYMEFDFEPDPDQCEKIGECAYEKGVSKQAVWDVMAMELRDWLMRDAGLEPVSRSDG